MCPNTGTNISTDTENQQAHVQRLIIVQVLTKIVYKSDKIVFLKINFICNLMRHAEFCKYAPDEDNF
jgi:hypothetical protein